MKARGRLILILFSVVIFVVSFSHCMDSADKLDATETARADEHTCRKCHGKIYDEYQHEWHAMTSRALNGDTMVVRGGNPKVPEYIFNEHLKMKAEKRTDGMYQVAYIDGKPGPEHRFDIAFGSGKNAQTYGFWKGKQIIQLQMSYFRSVNEWTNSPGYPSSIYYQGIGMRCLECHTSYAEGKRVPGDPMINLRDEIEPKSIVWSINCQRCHGAGARHVEFHLKHPEDKTARYIARFMDLSRKQRLDACGMCHSGNSLEVIKSPYAFKPGDSILNYYSYEAGSFASTQQDVHGNQLGLLEKSLCFIRSGDMSCQTCHSPHKPEGEGLIAHSRKCMSCHPTIKHSEKTLANAMVKTNCINCHMPLRPSAIITYQQAGRKDVTAYELHTHRIAVY